MSCPNSCAPASPGQVEAVTSAQRALGVAPSRCLPVMRMTNAQFLCHCCAGLTTDSAISIEPRSWLVAPQGLRQQLALHEATHHLRDDCKAKEAFVSRYAVAQTLLSSILQVPVHLFDKSQVVAMCAHTLAEAGVREYIGKSILMNWRVGPLWLGSDTPPCCFLCENRADRTAFARLSTECKQCLVEAIECQKAAEEQSASERSLGYLPREACLPYLNQASERLCQFHQDHAYAPFSAGLYAVVGADRLIGNMASRAFRCALDCSYYPVYALVWWLGNRAGLARIPVVSDIALGLFVPGLHKALEWLSVVVGGWLLGPTVRWVVRNFLWCKQCLNEAADEFERRPELAQELNYNAQQLRECAQCVRTLCQYHADKAADAQSSLPVSKTFWMSSLACALKETDCHIAAIQAFERDEKPRILSRLTRHQYPKR